MKHSKVFSLRERTRDVPWVSLVVLSALTAIFLLLANLAVISSFASAAFLTIFTLVNLSAWRLRARIHLHPAVPLAGAVLSAAALVTLLAYTWQHDRVSLAWIVGFLAAAVVLEVAVVTVRGRRPSAARADSELSAN